MLTPLLLPSPPPKPGPVSSVPVVTLHPPSREDFEGPYRNSTLLCQLRGPRGAPAPALRWLKDGLPLLDGVTTEGLVVATDGGHGAYVASSRATVTEAEWDAGAVYTCQAGEELRNTSKALECGCECGPP